MSTASTPTSQASAAANAIKNFLAVAPKKYYAITGTVASGLAGGSTSDVVFQREIPIIPAFCTALDYEITIPVALTLGATTGAATLSPLAPYSAVANQLTLGGAPPWPLTELVPWYLEGLTKHTNYDPAYPGLGDNSSYFSSTLDQGPNPTVIGGTGSLNPGASVTNTTSAAVTTDYTWTFKLRQQFQVKRHLMWGAIPFGDPENRPSNVTQLYPLVGSLPEQSLFVNGTLATAVTNGSASITATYELAYIDLLPSTMTSTPQPTVGYGLQLTAASTGITQAGALQQFTHRTSMLYESIHHILVNDGLPVRADYFGLWDTQDQQNARWAYDAQNNTFGEWFTKLQMIYRRYFPTGHYFVDMTGGVFPEIPSVTPYDAMMSPSQSYAEAFGVPVTPAMTTALRIPSGTTISGAYARSYSFGLVNTPY